MPGEIMYVGREPLISRAPGHRPEPAVPNHRDHRRRL
jgi:hypothetical protein